MTVNLQASQQADQQADQQASQQASLAARLVGQLVGMDFAADAEVAPLLADPRQVRERAFSALLLALHHLALDPLALQVGPGVPLVLQLEDLHWADDGSLDFLAALHDDSPPLLLLLALRPQLLERRPAWGNDTTT